MTCLVPATLLPATASALGGHKGASLPRAAPSSFWELPSAHKRVQTPLQTHATHVCCPHQCCTFPTGSHAHHGPLLLAQSAPCVLSPALTDPCVLPPHATQLCTHTLSALDTSQAPSEGGALQVLESCSYSLLGATTLLTSPFLVRVRVSPLHLQSISYYGNNMSLPGGGVQPQPKQTQINSSTQIHILGQSPCSSAGNGAGSWPC